ncbi:MAG: hypothetical protein N2745_02160 [Syntrophorhabdaceae bacterium]|nr:hypothetical protein [Syntrophorhabdaceae bacterium]
MNWNEYVKMIFERYDAVMFVSEEGEIRVAINKSFPTEEEKLEAIFEIENAVHLLLEAYEEFLEGYNWQGICS